MAKGARASDNKKNKARLKDKVFGPVEQARAERLNKRLAEVAAQPRPSEAADVNIIDASATTTSDVNGDGKMEGVQLNKRGKRAKPFQRSIKKGTWLQDARAAKKLRVEAKKKRKKETNRMTFKNGSRKAKK